MHASNKTNKQLQRRSDKVIIKENKLSKKKGRCTMNFELTQQQAAIQETARKFAQEELLPGVLERDANSEFPVEQFHKMGELGLVGLPYPKEVGGQVQIIFPMY